MKTPGSFEVNFDGLVGPTHNYAGLSYGNVASAAHRAQASSPRDAALQGLEKMWALARMGLKQGVLPPQERPDVFTLRALGFGAGGDDAAVLQDAQARAPEILACCCSGSSMWTANAATVSPSADTADGRVHFTAANLNSNFHRSIEHATVGRALQAVFADPKHFVHHAALPPGAYFGDEGAANHTRLCAEYGGPGVEFFVFGRYGFRKGEKEPQKYPARQTFEASEAISRLHGLDGSRTVFAQQSPGSIDAGVFHNDVTCVGNRDVLFYHEESFVDEAAVLARLGAAFTQATGGALKPLRVPLAEVSLAEAVKTYLFNSQLISPPALAAQGGMALVAPQECRASTTVSRYLERLLADPSQPIREVHYFDLHQSMNNGGGPACLRLRVALTQAELGRCNPRALLDDKLFESLTAWVKRHYRARLAPDQLADPALLIEGRAALAELTTMLGVGAIYPFQLLKSV